MTIKSLFSHADLQRHLSEGVDELMIAGSEPQGIIAILIASFGGDPKAVEEVGASATSASWGTGDFNADGAIGRDDPDTFVFADGSVRQLSDPVGPDPLAIVGGGGIFNDGTLDAFEDTAGSENVYFRNFGGSDMIWTALTDDFVF